MNPTDVRDWDAGDRRLSPLEAAPVAVSAPAVADPGSARRSGVTRSPLAGLDTAALDIAADHFREGLVLCDGDGVVRYVSAVAARLLPGVVPGELLAGSGIAEVNDPTDPAGGAEFAHGDRRLRIRRVGLDAGRVAWYVEDVTEAVRRADALLAERSRSGFLATASQRLGNPLHIDRAARAVARLAVPALGEVAVVVLAAGGGRHRWWRAAAGEGRPAIDGGELETPAVPPGIAAALDGAEPHEADWLVEQLADAGWLPATRSSRYCARAVPLPGSGTPSGALVVARPLDQPFEPADLDVLRGFAARAGAAVNAALLYREQAEIAETLQSSLLPAAPVPSSGVQWGTAYRPSQATLRIGGDFYGSHPLPDGGSLFFLGDVSGKGVEAAVFTGQLRQALQALRRVETDPQRLLRLLNDAVLETVRAANQGRFATMVLGLAQPDRDGGLTLTLAGGGHLPPLLLRADGSVQPVSLGGMLIGVVPDPHIGATTVRLARGETCVLYSDGVTEARGGRHGTEEFGPERLARALHGCAEMPAPALAERVEQLTCDWLGGGEHDDIAVLALRAVAPSGGRHLHVVPDPAAE
ncbi:PP2C family protein-serine/threonine phosphatase [Plantactinospora sp. KBS50]|uniref:PP2C family protein-serine/threonine phosphatase n=1 Tax=Plantactinospora sp. KBS50 TaxID=2024580 RepID=UPI001E391046|nr:PP2C family protein-serine/threonine phosphatase [Plantactinospora sp. KBS50]